MLALCGKLVVLKKRKSKQNEHLCILQPIDSSGDRGFLSITKTMKLK